MRRIRRIFELTPAQSDFRQASALYRGFVGGRGAGKSFVGAYDLIRRAERGKTYLVVGPTYTSLLDSSFRSFLGIARDLNVVDAGRLRKSAPPAVTLTTGAEILFRSGDDPEKHHRKGEPPAFALRPVEHDRASGHVRQDPLLEVLLPDGTVRIDDQGIATCRQRENPCSHEHAQPDRQPDDGSREQDRQ